MSANTKYYYRHFYEIFLGDITKDATYLFRMPREHADDYTAREQRTTYNNWTKKAVEVYLGYILHNAVPKNEINVEVAISDITRNAATDSLVGGRCYILTTQENVQVWGLNEVNPQTDNGNFNYTDEIRAITIPGSKGKNSIEVEITGHILGGQVVTGFIEQKGSQPRRDIKPGELIEISWNKYKRSLIQDSATLAVQIYNLESIKDYNLFRLGQQFEYGPKWNGGGANPRPNYGAYIPLLEGYQAPGSVTMGDVESTKAIEESVNRKVLDYGRALGLEAEFAEEIKLESGRAKQYSLIDINSRINSISNSVQAGVDKALKYFASLNQRDPEKIGISLESELRPNPIADDLRDLRDTADWINTPEVRKWAAIRMIRTMARDEPHSEQLRMINEIKKQDAIVPFNPVTANMDFLAPGAPDDDSNKPPPQEEDNDDD